MKNWSLNAKFVLVLSVFFGASVTITTVGVLRLEELNSSLNNLVEVVAKRVSYAKEVDAQTNWLANLEKELILEESTEGMNELSRSIDALDRKTETQIDELQKIASDAGKKDAAEMKVLLANWRKVHMEVRRLTFRGKNKEATALARGRSGELMAKLSEAVKKVVERNAANMEEESKRTDELVERARATLSLVGIISLILGSAFAFVILRSLSRAINRIIATLSDSSSQVSGAAQQIAASSEQLSQASTEQAASLQETASSIEEMNSMIKKNAESAGEAAASTSQCRESANRGKGVVEEVKRAMAEINSGNAEILAQIDDSNRQIGEIVKVIAEIGNKTKVINDIVFQTKLLSFNASVEAARAGEHGKGFAVVAEEVGNLAQMSGNAAKEISSMLDSSIKKVEGIVTMTKERVEKLVDSAKGKIDNGIRVAQQCGESLDEIVSQVSEMARMANEISTASQEQSRGIQEVTRAMNQLDQVTQENASTSEEAASAAESLAHQAEALKGSVVELVAAIKGGSGAREKTQADEPRKQTPSKPTAAGSTNVIVMKPKAGAGTAKSVAPEANQSGALPKAVGFEGVPAETDPRFHEAG